MLGLVTSSFLEALIGLHTLNEWAHLGRSIFEDRLLAPWNLNLGRQHQVRPIRGQGCIRIVTSGWQALGFLQPRNITKRHIRQEDTQDKHTTTQFSLLTA